MNTYHVYIMASASRVLYTGVTSDIQRRVSQHREWRPYALSTNLTVILRPSPRRLKDLSVFGGKNKRDSSAWQKAPGLRMTSPETTTGACFPLPLRLE